LRIVNEIAGSKRSGRKCLFEYKIGRKKAKFQWYDRYYAYGLFGTEVVQQHIAAFQANAVGDAVAAVEVKDVMSAPGKS
jgi:hypothetical protein